MGTGHPSDLRHNGSSLIDRRQIESQNIFVSEEFLMDGCPSRRNRDPQLDEAVWSASVKKNETKDKIGFARCKKEGRYHAPSWISDTACLEIQQFGLRFGLSR